MTEHQLDLFSDADPDADGHPPAPTPPAPPPDPASSVAAGDMDDAALIASLPRSGLADSIALAAEAGRRRLPGAIPALAALCRRFVGFGANRAVPEQVAALRALAEIGGREAGQAVSDVICRAVVQGPTLAAAVVAAGQLRSPLPADILGSLLRHADPVIRSAACRCVSRHLPDVMAVLADLLGDNDRTVADSAACALGRLGRSEARPALKRLLSERPSKEVVEAVSLVADEESMVMLGRLAERRPELADAVLDALDTIDHPRASTVAARVERLRQSSSA